MVAAKHALKLGIPYCDLGGDPETSAKIHKMAAEGSSPVFTDLGLAPGLVNIIAEHKVSELGSAHDVVMSVGGLPQNPQGFLKYGRTWSIDGLVNEYQGDCNILKDGKLTTVTALTSVANCQFNLGDKLVDLESFHTKGGSAHSIRTMMQMGVQNCEYRTLRFPGHAKAINFLIHECQLNNEQLYEVLSNACPIIKDDQVIVSARIDANSYQLHILADENWTAMQKATAFPTAAIAALLATKELNKPILDYMDININRMEENLQTIGNFPTILI